jgi:predicted amidophosphoribosyltransferase
MGGGTGRWAELGEAVLDLVVPQRCAGCQRTGTAWCPDCAAAVAGPAQAVPAQERTCAAAPHAGPAGRAVAAFKDDGARRLAAPLAGLLAEAVRAVLPTALGPDPGGEWGQGSTVWLVPVPARRSARRARGGDHMRELARLAAGRLRRHGLPVHRLDVLTHVRDSRDQVGLGRAARRANVAGTLAAAGPLPRGLLVVVDDVTTTGATLDEAARALRAAGPTGPLRAASITWAAPPVGTSGLASPGRRD